MGKILYDKSYFTIDDTVVISKEETQKLFKEMYEQGKFDAIADLEKKGKVVISKEEYEILIKQNKGLKEENHTLRLENNDLEAQVEQAHKETAEKWHYLIRKRLLSLWKDCEITTELYNAWILFFNEFAKKYGVEVEE